jgi:hypothetical protein
VFRTLATIKPHTKSVPKSYIGYHGQSMEGKPHGHGSYLWTSGDHYVGEWKVGQKHGRGVYYLSTGDVYTGDYKYDVNHGQVLV